MNETHGNDRLKIDDSLAFERLHWAPLEFLFSVELPMEPLTSSSSSSGSSLGYPSHPSVRNGLTVYINY